MPQNTWPPPSFLKQSIHFAVKRNPQDQTSSKYDYKAGALVGLEPECQTEKLQDPG
jgi:hypothetical protein